MMCDDNEALLTRLANKAKQKLNKLSKEECVKKNSLSAKYEYLTGNTGEEKKKLEKKIVQLLKNNPDCVDPIGKLIDHAVYDKLSEQKKELYVLNLSKNYCEICARLEVWFFCKNKGIVQLNYSLFF